MNKDYTRVGVLMGGLSAERNISIKTGHGVAGALREIGWKNVVEVHIDRNAAQAIFEAKINAAFVALHGKFGEDGCMQGMLEMMGIAYTGSGVQASAIAMDKLATKRFAQGQFGVTLAKHIVLKKDDETKLDCNAFDFPVVVKPLSTGSTIGINKANNQDELESAVANARKYGPTVLIEEFVNGAEFTVPVLNGKALPTVRIKHKGEVFDFNSKYVVGESTFECPADLPWNVNDWLPRMAEDAYGAIGCRGLARADFIYQPGKPPVFLEINTLPGMTVTSLSPLSAAAQGMTYPELCEAILLSATCEEAEPARSE